MTRTKEEILSKFEANPECPSCYHRDYVLIAMEYYATHISEAKDKRIKELERQNELHVKGKSVMGIMHDDCVKEIERLKGLIEKAHDAGYGNYEKYSSLLSWQQFKTENNL